MPPAEITSPINLRDLGTLIGEATGRPVRVERTQAGLSLEPPASDDAEGSGKVT